MMSIKENIRIDIKSVDDIVDLFNRNVIDIVQFDRFLGIHALALSIKNVSRSKNVGQSRNEKRL